MSQVTSGSTSADVAMIVRFVNLIAASARSPHTTRRLQTVVRLTITIADTRVLVRLMPDRQITVGQAATAMDVDLSRASRQLAHLETLGLVMRAEDPHDRRTSWFTITDAGRSLLRTWWTVWVNDYLIAVEDWATGDVVRLGRLIGRLHQGLALGDAVGPVVDVPADWSARAMRADVAPERRAALERLAPAVVGFVEWTGLTSSPAANHRRLGQLAKSPVAPRSLIALRVVARHGPLSVSELAERLGMDSSRASKHATELAEKSLLVRAVDTLDRRSSRLRVTPKGSEVIRRVDALQHETVREAVAGWPQHDLGDCCSLLERYTGYLATGQVDPYGWAVPPVKATRATGAR